MYISSIRISPCALESSAPTVSPAHEDAEAEDAGAHISICIDHCC